MSELADLERILAAVEQRAADAGEERAVRLLAVLCHLQHGVDLLREDALSADAGAPALAFGRQDETIALKH